MVDLILWRRSFIIFSDLLYDACVLSDSLHPSSLWWNVSEFRGGNLKVRGLDGWRHRNLARVNVSGVLDVLVVT